MPSTDTAREAIFTCNLCEALCGLRVGVEGERVTSVRGDPEDVFSQGHVCPKALAMRELYHDPDRVRRPLKRTAAGWQPVSWDEALTDIAARLRAIQAQHGRDAVALYVGNPVAHSHRSALASQVLTAAVGSRNRYDPNSQDSNPRLFACMQVYGDALAIPVPDIARTAHLLMLGANPLISGGSQMGLGDVRSRLRAVRERGGKLVLLDPRRNETAAVCDRHHFVRPGSDAALLLAMLHVLFTEGRVDEARVGASARNLPLLRAAAMRFAPARVERATGLDAATIRMLALELVDAPTSAVYARVGVCQSEFGPTASWLVEAINIVTGNFDREGGVLFPEAAADIGPLGRMLVGNVVGRHHSRVRGLPEFLGALPSAALSEEIETPGPGQVRALVCLAGNPVLSTPNGERLSRALAQLELVVAIDYYINETSRHAHYLLPPRHVFETGNFDILLARFTVHNVAKYSPPLVHNSADDTRDDWEIACELAARLRLPDRAFVRRAFASLTRKLPEQLMDLLLRLGPYGLSLAKLRAAPHGIDLGPLRPSQGKRVTARGGLADLAPAPFLGDLARLERWVDAPPEGLVMIGRRHLRGNNSWLHNIPTLAKGPDRARLMVNPIDAAERGLRDGASARVASRVGEVSALVEVSEHVMPGVVSLPHGYGHAVVADTLRVAGALPGASANALTDEQHVEPVLGTSVLSGVPVTVRPAKGSN